MLSQLAGLGLLLFGAAYLAIPKRIYHFGPDFLRETQPEPSEPGGSIILLYRFIGGCLVILSTSYIF